MDVPLSKKFEFPGSKKQYADSIDFVIEYMILNIKPDFKYKTLKNCNQQIDIVAKNFITNLKFDIAELAIDCVDIQYLDKKGKEESLPIKPKIEDKNPDKMIIELPDPLLEGEKLRLKILYSCGTRANGSFSKPRSGFHFIEDKNGNAYQSWTQGETTESRYWFPCIDHPQIKYKRELQITAPENFIVISNGESYREGNNNWIYKEDTSNPAYLTSVVIGDFEEEEDTYINKENKKIGLKYYWPKRIKKEDAMYTYSVTPDILKFFEFFLDTLYPYNKYSQVAVDEFEYGGMENTNATTLNENIFHDEIASIDFRDDISTVVHEIAHQWFGDLVTCEDWRDLWLNEGFANYCEALYLDRNYIYNSQEIDQNTRNEFFYHLHSSVRSYFREFTSSYQRPIVTNKYKHPDDLLDRHTYSKGGIVLHMIRSILDDDNKFRQVLKTYLAEHKFKNAETDNLRQVFEKVTGSNYLQFFDQWLFQEGHPILEIEYSLLTEQKENEKKIKIKITQKQKESFVFPLEVRIVYKNESPDKKPEKFIISSILFEEKIIIPENKSIAYISIDPNLKLLKEISSIKIIEEKENFTLNNILVSQLKDGYTIIERIQAANFLKNHYSEGLIDILKDVLKKEKFYGVGVEICDTLGSFKDESDITKTNKTYDCLRSLLENEFTNFAPQIKRAILSNIGRFQRHESISSIDLILSNNTESYLVRSAAATALGLSSLKFSSKEKLNVINKLEEIVNKSNSFRQLISGGAISGLQEFYKDSDPNIVTKVGSFLLSKSDEINNYYIRLSAITALGKFLFTKEYQSNNSIRELNNNVFNKLIKFLDVSLINNTRRFIKTNIATSLANSDAFESAPNERIFKTIQTFSSVIQYEVDGVVRKSVERSLYVIQDYIKKWIDNPTEIKFVRKFDKIEKELEIGKETLQIELSNEERNHYNKVLETVRSLDLP
jgi:aminopeptidase N